MRLIDQFVKLMDLYPKSKWALFWKEKEFPS